MKKICIIQSRETPKMLLSEQESYKNVIGKEYGIDFLSSLNIELEWNVPETILKEYDAIIFGGSGDFDFDGGRHAEDSARKISQEIKTRLTPLITRMLEEDFPFLGICYGHQIIGEVCGVPVIHDVDQKKVGSHKVRLTTEGERDPIFSKLPYEFYAQYGHKDSLSGIPPETTVLAIGERCSASAIRYGRKGYTVQFHPEISHEDVFWKLKNSPGYLPEGVDVELLVQPSLDASTIIPRFLETVLE